MAEDARFRIYATGTNVLDPINHQRIEDFLNGRSKHRRFVERIKLNEEYEEFTGRTVIITLEMHHQTGHWRKLRSRSTSYNEILFDANGDFIPRRPVTNVVICGR